MISRIIARQALEIALLVAIPSSWLLSTLGIVLYFQVYDETPSTFYTLVAIFWAVSACFALLVCQKSKTNEFLRWKYMESPMWSPPGWEYPPGCIDLGMVVHQNESDGMWEAELHGLSQLLPGRPELGWIQALGSYQGEAIANLWLAVNAAQSGYVGPKGTRFGPGWRIRSRFDYTGEDFKNEDYVIEEVERPDVIELKGGEDV